MRVTFLAHSGFLVELPSVLLLFDYLGAGLPALPDKPLLIFASHRHEDHFTPAIFPLDDGSRETRFLLGKDIKLSQRHLEQWGVSSETAGKCLCLGGNETASPLSGVTVETLPSTDEGVAFLVTCDGQTIFHAGDLNWWHWEGEPKDWNRNMEVNFKRYCEPLRGRRLDLALLPLDPRQERDGFRGAKHFLETAEIRRFIPMHQREKFAFTDDFLAQYPQFRSVTEKVTEAGQIFTF